MISVRRISEQGQVKICCSRLGEASQPDSMAFTNKFKHAQLELATHILSSTMMAHPKKIPTLLTRGALIFAMLGNLQVGR